MANMAKFKKKWKFFWGYVWDMLKAALLPLLMYVCAGSIVLMLGIKFDEDVFSFKKYVVVWTVVCIVAAVAYNGFAAWANGGTHYEMLASGNVKRATAEMYGEGYKISSHKESKEYRVWKGFLIGGIVALVPLGFGIVFGCMQTTIDARLAEQKMGAVELLGLLLSGWSIMPVYYANAVGSNASYFLTCLFAILPVAVTGGFYIAGAYARRAKAIRQQEIADKAAQAEANKPKKINYGGLPGTKPKKRK